MTAIITEQLVAGLFSACFLFLCSVGLSLVFGAGNIFNFAHGSFFVLGAYVCHTLASLGVEPLLAVGLAGTAVTVIGLLVYSAVIARVSYAGAELGVQVLTTYALLLIVSDIVRGIWGSGFVSMSLTRITAGGDASAYQTSVIALTTAIAVAVMFVLHGTRAGRLVRAVTSDAALLRHIGRRPESVAAGVFAIASGLAAIGGAVAVPLITITPFTGDELIVMALIVTVVGGRGNAVGALLASVVIAELVALSNLFAPRLAIAVPYAVAVAVLALRPSGLLQGTASDATTARA